MSDSPSTAGPGAGTGSPGAGAGPSTPSPAGSGAVAVESPAQAGERDQADTAGPVRPGTVTERLRGDEPTYGDPNAASPNESKLAPDQVGTATERARRAAGTYDTEGAERVDPDELADTPVDEVVRKVRDNPTLRDQVVALERAGKARKGVLEPLADRP